MNECNMVEVVNEIKAGDIVAVTNLTQLYDGAKVKVAENK